MLSNEDKYTLKTKQLSLQIILQQDIAFIHRALSDERVTRYYSVHFNSLEETQEQMDWYANLLDNNTGIWWKLVEHQNLHEVGACGFNNWDHHTQTAEIGFWLVPAYQGRGFMSEALSEIVRFGFQEMDFQEIWAEVEQKNHKSLKVLQAKGFQHVEERSFSEEKNGNQVWVDVLIKREEHPRSD